jgi:hypothetical protein
VFPGPFNFDLPISTPAQSKKPADFLAGGPSIL